MIDPMLDTATVVTQDDATWIPLSTIPIPDVTIAPALQEEFSTMAQVAALISLMAQCGIDPSQLKLTESSGNWNYPPFKKLIYLRTDGPKLYTLSGPVTVARDDINTELSINVGAFINKQRLKGLNQPPGVDMGDYIAVKMVNQFFPWLYWVKELPK